MRICKIPFCAALATSIVLLGCAPYSVNYLRLDQKDAIYTGTMCWGSAGPPANATIPFNGIVFSVNLAPQSVMGYSRFSIDTPKGNTIKILDKSISLEITTATGTRTLRIPLQKADWINVDVFEPIQGETFKIRRILGTDEIRHTAITFYFKAEFNDALAVKLYAPRVNINGIEYLGPAIPFVDRLYVGTIPLNC